MSPKEILSLLAGILCLASFGPYIYTILKGKTKPKKATWFVWMSIDALALLALWASDNVNGLIIGATAGASIIALLSLRYGVPGWTVLDISCLIAAGIGAILWQAFASPLLGLVISQVINVIGSLPTIHSVWQDPSRENRLVWTLGVISNLLGVAAISAWTVGSALQPMTFLAINSTILLILLTRRRSKKELTPSQKKPPHRH